jgi:xanthine dehydrogenase accessory factor
MYNVALTVAACLRANTRVDVAWVVSAEGWEVDPGAALALTPGGGRSGELLGGLVDAELAETAQSQPSRGRLLEVTVTDLQAAIAGHDSGGRVRCALTPASELPEALWPLLHERAPVCLVSRLEGDEIVATRLWSEAAEGDATDADELIAGLVRGGRSTAAQVGDELVTVLWPVPQLVVSGSGPLADALADAARLLGWQVTVAGEVGVAVGLMARLSRLDCAVVMGHDVESSSRALEAALASPAGYVGALGSLRMQQQRADWLAYRGIDDLDRVHGPAGVDIGARTPGEIAVSILAEAIAVHRSAT